MHYILKKFVILKLSNIEKYFMSTFDLLLLSWIIVVEMLKKIHKIVLYKVMMTEDTYDFPFLRFICFDFVGFRNDDNCHVTCL